MANRKFIIGFDEAHKPRGRINSNYTELADFLNQNGFQCQSYEAYPITAQSLDELDILVFVCPDFSKVSKNEIDAIKDWVTKKGGGLLLMNHAGGDKGRRSNLSEVGQQFGIIFENDQCLDNYNNIGVENLPVINIFNFPHPINDDLNEICFRAGCTLSVGGANTTPVISSGPNAEPPETPVLLASENGEGRVIGIGSYEMFRDNTNGGFDYDSHSQLALNMFEWLKTTKREQLSAQGSISQQKEVNVAQNSHAGGNASETTENSGKGRYAGVVPSITYESNVKIVAKKELLKAFEDQLTALISFKERMLQEFDVLTENTQNLIRSVIATEEDMVALQNEEKISEEEVETVQEAAGESEEDFGELSSIMDTLSAIEQQGKEEQESAKTPPSPSMPPAPKTPPDLSPPPGGQFSNSSQQANNQEKQPRVAQPITGSDDEFSLTPLPNKPSASGEDAGYENYENYYGEGYEESQPDYVASEEEDLSGSADYSQTQEFDYKQAEGQQEEQYAQMEAEQKESTAADQLEMTREEIEQEMDSLNKKLNSITNLRSFVVKKFDSGKINKSKYDKQIKKLDNDKNKARFRIEELQAILEEM